MDAPANRLELDAIVRRVVEHLAAREYETIEAPGGGVDVQVDGVHVL